MNTREPASFHRDELVRSLHAKLDEWNSRIDQLEAQMERMDADARAAQMERIQAFRNKRDYVLRKLEAFSRAGDDAKQDLKQGVILAVDSLKEAFSSAASRFR